jgi:hypothetical protein
VPVPDLISSRAAEAKLGKVGLSRKQARRVLAAGFAGPPVVTLGALLYRAADVAALARWPLVDGTAVDAACPSGVFVARRDLDLAAGRAEQLEALREGWDLSSWTRVWIRVVCENDGRLPFVTTVAGFVALGAEIIGVALTGERQCRLELRDSGAWFEALRSTRFPTGPGRDWVLRGSPCSSVSRSVGESPP